MTDSQKKAVGLDELSHYKAMQDLENAEKFQPKGSTDLTGAVRYDSVQVLTEEQKAQARANIGAGTGDGSENGIIIIEPETLDEETMTGTISAESMKKIDDNAGKKPIYLSFGGMFIPYIFDGMFSLYLSGSSLRVDINTYTLEFTAMAEGIEVPEGVVTTDENGLIPASLLPSYVDDVIEGYFHNNAFWLIYEGDDIYSTLIEPESGKIYIDLSTGNTYRWGGSVYVRLNPDEYTFATNADIEALFN